MAALSRGLLVAMAQMTPEQRQMPAQIQLRTLRSIAPDQMQKLIQLFGGGRR